MSSPALRASLFALAREIDLHRDRVVFSDWTRPARSRQVETSLAENAVLNLFLTPRTVAAAAAAARSVPGNLDRAVESLVDKGLLSTEAEWSERRARQPYTNFPSLTDEAPCDFAPFDSYEAAYAGDYVPWNQLPVATDLLSLAPLPVNGAGPRLLDAGCGSGHNLALIEALGFRCAGIDVSATAVAQIRARAENPDDFAVGSVAHLPWPEASFDVVLDVGCLHCLHPDEVAGYVAEVRRVLAPGGRFLCRSFKPREEAVLRAQPVKMERLGYTPDEICGLFSTVLPVQLVKEGPVHGFYLGSKEVPTPE